VPGAGLPQPALTSPLPLECGSMPETRP
jgi:hypothetical protein